MSNGKRPPYATSGRRYEDVCGENVEQRPTTSFGFRSAEIERGDNTFWSGTRTSSYTSTTSRQLPSTRARVIVTRTRTYRPTRLPRSRRVSIWPWVRVSDGGIETASRGYVPSALLRDGHEHARRMSSRRHPTSGSIPRYGRACG